ncbi:arsenic resistance protein [Neomicrococcus lactis]|uniref:arsenic resistance protein n=1 Tax=Neomicrococcus lactis TaxID=732241 RepID=UPI00230042F3|nr:hypothetical protein [Neomicrococcus lactis]
MSESLKDRLEAHQVWVYLLGAACGVGLSFLFSGFSAVADFLVWPLLAVLLLAAFAQTPLERIPEAFRHRKFLATALLANFVVMPAFVWILLRLMPADPAIRLGLALVLVMPCTDWFLTFTQLGKGNMPLALSLTPVNLVVQLLLLPLYVPLLVGEDLPPLDLSVILAAVLVLLIPLAASVLAEFTLFKTPAGASVREGLSWLPVPLLAVVLACVTGANAPRLPLAASAAPSVVVATVTFALFAVVAGVALTKTLRLHPSHGRTLTFTLMSRNSFVVLPIALALPAGWELTSLTIVTQSFVELFALALAVHLVPRLIKA